MAYATKVIDLSIADSLDKVVNLDREQVETEDSFIFLGIVVMDNQLKENTKPVIDELNKSKIRSIIATGDNVFTAISVAKKCAILKKTRKVIFAHQIDIHNENGTGI